MAQESEHLYFHFRGLGYEENSRLLALRAQYEVRLIETLHAIERDGWTMTESGRVISHASQIRLVDVLIEMVGSLYETAAKAYSYSVGPDEYKELVDLLERRLTAYCLRRWAQLTDGRRLEPVRIEFETGATFGFNEIVLSDTLSEHLRSKVLNLELQMWQAVASPKPGDLSTEKVMPPTTTAPATLRDLASRVSADGVDGGAGLTIEIRESQDAGARWPGDATTHDGFAKREEISSEVGPDAPDQRVRLTRRDDSVERINPGTYCVDSPGTIWTRDEAEKGSSRTGHGNGPNWEITPPTSEGIRPGRELPREPTGPATPSSSPGHDRLFRKRGEVWEAVFAGGTVYVKNSKGMEYIAHLLRSPDQEVHSAQLFKAIRGDLGASVLGSAGEVLDDTALTQYRSRIEDLNNEVYEAERNNDEGRGEAARTELDQLQEQVISAVGRGGRPRKAHDDADRIRKGVGNAIERAIISIREHHPALAEYLKLRITRGMFLSYQGDGIEWEF